MVLKMIQAIFLFIFCSCAQIGAEPKQPPSGSVKGTLFYPDHQPAKGFKVSLMGTSRTSTFDVEMTTDDKGNFTAQNLGFGSYLVTAYLNAVDSRYPPGTGQFFDKHLVRFMLSPDHPMQILDVQLDPPDLLITGTAADKATGHPVAVQISMWQIEDPENKWAKFASSAIGKYRFWMPPGKTIKLRASADGYRDFETTIPAITNGVDPVVDIDMIPRQEGK